VDKRFTTPLWRLVEALNGEGAALRQAVRVMDAYSLDLIRRRRETGEYRDRRDLLSRFMAWTADEEEGGGQPYVANDKFLRDVVMNFLIAGRDTTAQALSWAVYNLSRNPEVEARLVAEVTAALPLDKSPGEVTFDVASHALPYTTAVVQVRWRWGGGAKLVPLRCSSARTPMMTAVAHCSAPAPTIPVPVRGAHGTAQPASPAHPVW
jgi:cytochrome P450